MKQDNYLIKDPIDKNLLISNTNYLTYFLMDCKDGLRSPTECADILIDAIKHRSKHNFWGAGEPDCPQDIKAPNGNLFKLRCKVCGQDNPEDTFCIGYKVKE